MHRRQFMQTLNAMGASFILPASAFYDEGPSVTTSTTIQLLVKPANTVEVADSGWDIPKVDLLPIARERSRCIASFRQAPQP